MKRFLFVLIFAALLTACSPTEEPVVQNTTQVEIFTEEIPQEENSRQAGKDSDSNYIVLRYYSTGVQGGNQIFADLVFYNKIVCTWDLGETQPWERGEQQLYFAPLEDNCPELDPRNTVIWYVHSNYAEILFEGNVIGETLVWQLAGAERILLERK